MPFTRALTGAALLALIAAGCGGDDADEDPTTPSTTDELAAPVVFGGPFSTDAEAFDAVTYDESLVPADASAEITVEPQDGSTTFELSVTGLEPDHDFGAHLHTDPCGEVPDDAGPHYQDDPDPQQPSSDPEYANPENEIWLDFTTDADGEGGATANVDWRPRPGEANSVVIHAHETSTGGDDAGSAGERLACVNTPL